MGDGSATPEPRALRLVVRPGDGQGFRLAGVAVAEVAPGEETGALRALLADPHAGVIAVEEEVWRALPEAAVRPRPGGLPVLLPFALPRRWGEEGRGRAWVAALIRRAVGYHVRLGGEGDQ